MDKKARALATKERQMARQQARKNKQARQAFFFSDLDAAAEMGKNLGIRP